MQRFIEAHAPISKAVQQGFAMARLSCGRFPHFKDLPIRALSNGASYRHCFGGEARSRCCQNTSTHIKALSGPSWALHRGCRHRHSAVQKAVAMHLSIDCCAAMELRRPLSRRCHHPCVLSRYALPCLCDTQQKGGLAFCQSTANLRAIEQCDAQQWI